MSPTNDPASTLTAATDYTKGTTQGTIDTPVNVPSGAADHGKGIVIDVAPTPAEYGVVYVDHGGLEIANQTPHATTQDSTNAPADLKPVGENVPGASSYVVIGQPKFNPTTNK